MTSLLRHHYVIRNPRDPRDLIPQFHTGNYVYTPLLTCHELDGRKTCQTHLGIIYNHLNIVYVTILKLWPILQTVYFFCAAQERCVLIHVTGSGDVLTSSQVNSYQHYSDVIMSTMASQITSLTVVYSTVYSDADQRKHQSSASLAFVWGIHRDRWIPRTKGQLRGKCFHLMTSSWTVWPWNAF